MMKIKISALTFAVLLAVSATACGTDRDNDIQPVQTITTASVTDQATTTAATKSTTRFHYKVFYSCNYDRKTPCSYNGKYDLSRRLSMTFMIITDPEDFYYGHEDDFWDYEDAEDYFDDAWYDWDY